MKCSRQVQEKKTINSEEQENRYVCLNGILSYSNYFVINIFRYEKMNTPALRQGSIKNKRNSKHQGGSSNLSNVICMLGTMRAASNQKYFNHVRYGVAEYTDNLATLASFCFTS